MYSLSVIIDHVKHKVYTVVTLLPNSVDMIKELLYGTVLCNAIPVCRWMRKHGLRCSNCVKLGMKCFLQRNCMLWMYV